jgi:hypothetical protein
MELLAVAKPKVSKWGEVKEEGTGGGVSLSLGVRGLSPWENFQKTDACR